MTGLLLGVFAFFGGHTLLWLARSIGFAFFGIGLVLLGLIIYAMITRLTH